jgi:predicted permease
MSTLAQDLRYALRQLRKSPAFTLTAIITLGLGIGVNAAMFSVIEQVILRALPYPNGPRLVDIGQVQRANGQGSSFSLPDMRDYQARSHSLQALAFYTVQFPTMGGTENPQVTPEFVTSANFFTALGVRPALGRAFLPGDSRAGHNRVIILSHHAWQKYFHGDPSIIGRPVPINGDPLTVIGVLPAGVSFPVNADDEIFSPLNVDDKDLQDRASGALQAIALLRPGVTPAQAQSEVNGIHDQLARQYSDETQGEVIHVLDYHTSVTLHSRRALFALDWAVLAVWLIACANVAGLMLTRTNGRRREIAIRGALGADRSRITRQFLTESLLLALAGSAAGLGIAFLALRLLRKFLANAVLYGSDIHINAGVFAFLLFASCISALLFGLAPAWHASSVPAQEGLREGTAAAGTSKRQALWRDGLVVTEITLTLALLIAAGLMMQTLLSLRRADLGFATEHVVTGSLYLPTHGPWWTLASVLGKPSSLVQSLFTPLGEKLGHLPGVASVGFTTVRPLLPQWNFVDSLKFKDRPQSARGEEAHAQVRAATAGYFRAMGIRLLAGRLFGDQDGPATPVKILVNQEFVKENFRGVNPLGQDVQIADNGPRQWGTIVGVVENAKQRSPGEPAQAEMDINLDQLTPADMFYPILATFHMDIVVRGRAPLGALTDAIRRNVHALQPEVAVQDIQPMQQVVDDALGGQALAARLLGIFGLAALLIAVAGIYGLLAYSVSQRTRELGVRMALGAERADILWLILRHALVLLAAGVAIGLATAWAASGIMRSFLYGLSRYDAATIVLIVLALGVCGVAASYLPARRAAAIDPIEALRTE